MQESEIYTTMVVPFPRTTLSINKRSMPLAATDIIHGAMLATDLNSGPLLPAEFTTSIPFAIAWKAPIATESSENSIAYGGPIEIEIMSTPSAIASSKAANISASSHPDSEQTLYAEILAEGTPPLAVPCPSPKKLTPSTLFPAAVEAVWDPCPNSSLAVSYSPCVE